LWVSWGATTAGGRVRVPTRIVMAFALVTGLAFTGNVSRATGAGWLPSASNVGLGTPRISVSALGPSARYGHAMAYDSARDQVILFGGAWTDPNGFVNFLNDTWRWDGSSWTKVTPPVSPAPRAFHAMAYDSKRGRIVLFGGFGAPNSIIDDPGCGVFIQVYPPPGSSGRFGDTWEWDGQKWLQLTPPLSPPERYKHAMVYDSARARVLLFGGCGLGDTWEWDGATWTEHHPTMSPEPRGAHSMAYDSVRGRVVLFGGSCQGSCVPHTYDDTWEWDGKTWIRVETQTSPGARMAHAMVYDAALGRTLLFGGTRLPVGYPSPGQTWTWDGAVWALIATAVAPPERWHEAMAYDSTRSRTVLFGGLVRVPCIASVCLSPFYGQVRYGEEIDYADTWELSV
jgi:hypothetical protein